MNIYLLYFIPVILVWSLGDFAQKEYSKHLSNLEIMYANHIVYAFVFILGFIYLYFYKKKELNKGINNIKFVPTKTKLIMIIMVLLSFLSYYFNLILIKNFDISYTTPMIRGGSAMLILLISYIVYNETMTINKIIGFTFITIGIFILNFKDVMKFLKE